MNSDFDPLGHDNVYYFKGYQSFTEIRYLHILGQSEDRKQVSRRYTGRSVSLRNASIHLYYYTV
jgi:hypothetical protein